MSLPESILLGKNEDFLAHPPPFGNGKFSCQSSCICIPTRPLERSRRRKCGNLSSILQSALLSRRRACCPHMRALLRARRARRLAPRPPRFICGGKIPPGQPAKGAFWFSFCAICLSFSKLSCPGENECKALHGMCSLQIAFRSCAQRRGCEAMCRMTAEHADDPLNDHPNPTKHRACSAAVLDALCFFDDKYPACSAKR